MTLKVSIVPVGEPLQATAEALLSRLEESDLRADCTLCPRISAASEAYNPSRNQYWSTVLLYQLRVLARELDGKVLGMTELDLYVPKLNFVFGEALYHENVAIISTYRLRPILYGGGSEEIFLTRVTKEAVHELGHTLGLPHCAERRCVMRFSNSVADTDEKSERFCEYCRKRLQV